MSKAQPSPPQSPSLDSDCDNRTRWEKRLSGSNTDADGSASEPEPDEWNRQQKRVFHRVNTVLHYWESRDYQVAWVTLTSSEESDDADELAYNARKLRQTIERARLAYDGDGNAHSLAHLNELEHLTIRTSEGPEGKGVLHLFWAWEPIDGQHSRELYIPQEWLAEQWGRIHGAESGVSGVDRDRVALAEMGLGRAWDEIESLWVWIEEYGGEDYHDRSNIARYCVTQYLGEHGEALEHVSWSHGRTLGGSLVEAWDAIKAHTEGLKEAVARWEDVIAGESVTFGSTSDYFEYGLTVEPPPNLGTSMTEEPVHTPPEDHTLVGPEQNTVRRTFRDYTEHVGAEGRQNGLCPSCDEYHVMEREGETATCGRCGATYAVGSRVVETEFSTERWDFSAASYTRQTRLWEFGS